MLNNPLRYTDPSGHESVKSQHLRESYQGNDGCGPNSITPCWDPDLHLCGLGLGCSGNTGSEAEWIAWNLFEAPPYLIENVEETAFFSEYGSGIFGMGMDAREFWTGIPIRHLGKLGFGLDAWVQLADDSNRNDLTFEQRIARAGIAGLEGSAISSVSGSLANRASMAVMPLSIKIAIVLGQPWIPPIAVAGTWVGTYAITNVGLTQFTRTYVDPIVMPGGD